MITVQRCWNVSYTSWNFSKGVRKTSTTSAASEERGCVRLCVSSRRRGWHCWYWYCCKWIFNLVAILYYWLVSEYQFFRQPFTGLGRLTTNSSLYWNIQMWGHLFDSSAEILWCSRAMISITASNLKTKGIEVLQWSQSVKAQISTWLKCCCGNLRELWMIECP